MTEKKSTEDLITALNDDLKPVRPIADPSVRAATYFFAGLFSVLAVGVVIGFRMDLVKKATSYEFALEMLLVLLVAYTASWASAWLSVPDGHQKKQVIVLPYVIILAGLILGLREVILHGFELPVFSLQQCVIDATLMGVIPVALMIFLMRSGAPTRPILGAGVNIVAAGAIGYFGLRLSCGSDLPGHVCIYHILPFLVFGFLFGMVARRLYRW